MAQTPENRVHLFRLQMLIIDGGLLVFRNLIDQTLTAQGITLSACLNQESAKINHLKNRGIITQKQYDILFPTGGQVPNTSQMDITLIIFLLRCLKCFGLNTNFDWTATPIITDTSIEADISRLKAYRNEISHLTQTTDIYANRFVTLWNDIEQILVRQSSPALNIQQTIADFKTCLLDPGKEKRVQEEIEIWKYYEPDIDRLKEEIMKAVIEMFTEFEKTLEETNRRYDEQIELMKRQINALFKAFEILGLSTKVGTTVKASVKLRASEPRTAEELENVLFQVIKESITHSESPESNKTVRKTVDNLAQDMNDNGFKVEDVSEGSIVYTIKCESFQDLIALIDYLDGHMFKKHLEAISRALTEATGKKIEIHSMILTGPLSEELRRHEYEMRHSTGKKKLPVRPVVATTGMLAIRQGESKGGVSYEQIEENYQQQKKEGLEMTESSGVENCRKVLVKNYVAVKKYLHPDPIIDCDTGFELLTVVDRKNIKGKDPTDKNETLLRKVISKGAKGYTDFKERLRKTWQTDLLELIVCAENGQDTEEIKSRLEKTAVLSPEYIKHRGEVKDSLFEFYKTRHSHIFLSPLFEEKDTPLASFYIRPELSSIVSTKNDDKIPVKSLSEIFKFDKTENREIYVLADAGLGKTAFSKYLANVWCQAHCPDEDLNEVMLKDDVDCMQKFDFLFLVLLRDSDDLCSIDELIFEKIVANLGLEETLSKDILLKILKNEECLIILDGLDEWTHPDKKCYRSPRSIPHRNDQKKCTILTTTRPWKLGVLDLNSCQLGKRIKLTKLCYNSSVTLTKRILQRWKSHSNKDALHSDVTQFMKTINKRGNDKLAFVPLLLIYTTCLWCEGVQIGDSKCDLYIQ